MRAVDSLDVARAGAAGDADQRSSVRRRRRSHDDDGVDLAGDRPQRGLPVRRREADVVVPGRPNGTEALLRCPDDGFPLLHGEGGLGEHCDRPADVREPADRVGMLDERRVLRNHTQCSHGFVVALVTDVQDLVAGAARPASSWCTFMTSGHTVSMTTAARALASATAAGELP